MPQTNNINSLVSKVQDASIVLFKVSCTYMAPYFKRVRRIIYYAISFCINKAKEACITYSVGYAKAPHCPSSKG